MRKLIVAEHISLDGVIQGPGSPKEDPSGGFSLGGWTVPYFDKAILGATFALLAAIGLGLLGISPIGKELAPPAGFFAASVLLVAYVLFAQRRATALVKAEAEKNREQAEDGTGFSQMPNRALP